MGDTVGTPQGVMLDGLNYNVASDANFTMKNQRHEIEPVPTSGRTFKKMTAQAQVIEGVDLTTNALEHERLVALNDRTDSYPIGYTDAEGNNYKSTGYIKLDSRETQDGKTSLTLVNDTGGWTLFSV